VAVWVAVPLSARAQDSIESSTMDFGVCVGSTLTVPTFLNGGPGGGPSGYCYGIFSDNSPGSQTPVLCLGTPLAIAAHFAVRDSDPNANGAGVGQDFTAVITGPHGYKETDVINGPSQDSGHWDIAEFNIALATTAGTYTVSIVSNGTTYHNGPGDLITVLPNAGTGTFILQDCGGPPPTKPGCGFGDTNHDHTGPPNDKYSFFSNQCPAAAGHNK
jgi:hypothetical protein